MTTEDAPGKPTPSRKAPFARWLTRTLILSALGATAWFGWGAWEGHRFEARVAALHEAGAILPAFVDAETTADPDNGYTMLKASVEEAREIESAIDSEFTDDLDIDDEAFDTFYERDGPFSTWTDRAQAHERKVLRGLAPLVERWDAILKRPRIRGERVATLDGALVWEAMIPLRTWARMAIVDPTSGRQQLDRMLRFFARWEPIGGDRMVRMALMSATVLPTLMRYVETHDPLAAPPAWKRTLLAEERLLLSSAADETLETRTMVVWLLESWRRGEDPLREHREKLGAVLEVFDTVPTDLVDDEDDSLGRAVGLLKRVRAMPLMEPPYQGWYERPCLEHLARSLGEDIPLAAPKTPTVAGLRARIEAAGAQAEHKDKVLLRTIARLRLAVAALTAHATVQAESEHDDADARDRREHARLWAMARAREFTPDAMSGERFLVTRDGDRIVIQPPASRAREILDEEDHLLWSVPAR